jgi:hypothetical protein
MDTTEEHKMEIFELTDYHKKSYTWQARLNYLGTPVAFVYTTGQGLKYAPISGKGLSAARLHAMAEGGEDLDVRVLKMQGEL